jgi:nucleotide-binding universal stress UspA family protein
MTLTSGSAGAGDSKHGAARRRRRKEQLESGGIVCATDFWKSSLEAAQVAAAMAAQLHKPMILAHVLERGEMESDSASEQRRLESSAEERVRLEAAKLERPGLRIIPAVVNGAAADTALLQFVDDHRPSLVVVASEPKTSWSRFVVGSVSERLAERAEAPILVVRDAEPLLRWAQGEKPLKVFVGLTFKKSAEVALLWVRQLLKIRPCEIVAGHVHWPAEGASRLGLPPQTMYTEVAPKLEEALQRDCRRKLDEYLGEGVGRVVISPNWGSADAALIEMAIAEDADLIVVGAEHRWRVSRLWHPSVSCGVLRHTSLNVAVVPTRAERQSGVGIVPRFSRVLAATDLTEFGDEAVGYAYATLPWGGTVKILHVLPNERAKAGAKPEKREKDCGDKLQALIPVDAGMRDITTEIAVLRDDDPAAAIVHEGERFGADLICVASHRRSRIGRTLLGSVAQEVMKRSERPVLVVRP